LAEWQNLQTAFKAHLVQVRNERHAQIERDQGLPLFPEIPGQLPQTSCRTYFSHIYVTSPNHGYYFVQSILNFKFELSFLPMKVFGYINAATNLR
jgi:hypothetical protein